MKKLYGVVYKMTLKDYNKFYIGSTKKDINKYWGSGHDWNKFIDEHNIERNDENIKKEVLLKVYTNEKDLRESEEKEIVKYCSVDKFGDLVVSHPDCLNIDPYTETFYNRKGNCNECGYPLQSHKHAKTCSKYREIKTANPCPECGVVRGHTKDCPNYKVEPCPECGAIRSHLDTCSRSRGKCPECGYSLQSNKHAKTCSQYKPETVHTLPCPECGGVRGAHAKTCSKYTQPKRCSECGHINHVKTCSHYTMGDIVCDECKGTTGNHKSWCSHYDMPVCPECGVEHGFHLDTCSHSKGKCPECGYSLRSNHHAPTCSKYVDNSCKYCGSKSRHKVWCTNNNTDKAKSISYVCTECKGVDGKHEKTCSCR